MELVRLVYSSQSNQLVDWSMVKDILASAQPNNEDKDVTGILLNSGMTFLQVLEGDKETVRDLYNHISKDQRHYDCEIHALERIDDRAFGNWKMCGFDVKRLSDEDKDKVLTKYGDENGELFIPRNKDSILELVSLIEDVQIH